MEGKHFQLFCIITIIFLLHVESKVVTVGVPVVYTKNNGGGADEIRAPAGGSATMQFCAGGTVINAWYTPYDNINDLSAIRQIDVTPSGTSALLTVAGYSNPRDGRVRIKVYAEIEN